MSALGAGAPPSRTGIEFLESTCHQALAGQCLVVCGGSFSAKQGSLDLCEASHHCLPCLQLLKTAV